MEYWTILVLAAVRLGCNFDYDKLHNLAEEHRSPRSIMGVAGWDNSQSFDWRRINENIRALSPDTIERINHAIVGEGHRLAPHAAEKVRGDSFVVATNVHYPTDSSLIGDGLRQIVPLAVKLARVLEIQGWRQHKHLLVNVRKQLRTVDRAAASKGKNRKRRLEEAYRTLIEFADDLLKRALELLDPKVFMITPCEHSIAVNRQRDELHNLLNKTIYVCDLARRRVLQGETIENDEKLLSLFEPETQLIHRGKTPNPIEFGHRVLVIEDSVGFVCHYTVMQRGAVDSEVVVGEMKRLQERLGGRIQRASHDRGFHSPENQVELAKLVPHPCLPKPGMRQAAKQEQESTVEFREGRRKHSGIESAIGALQCGNGLTRCRDRTFGGYCRYVGLGILGRNLHVLGKRLLARKDKTCAAARTSRDAA